MVFEIDVNADFQKKKRRKREKKRGGFFFSRLIIREQIFWHIFMIDVLSHLPNLKDVVLSN